MVGTCLEGRAGWGHVWRIGVGGGGFNEQLQNLSGYLLLFSRIF